MMAFNDLFRRFFGWFCYLFLLILSDRAHAELFGNETSPVECSSSQSVYQSQIEIVLLGEDGFPGSRERNALSKVLIGVYNRLTELNCDSNFRKISTLEFAQMTNRATGETIWAGDTAALELIDGLPSPPPGGPPGGGPPETPPAGGPPAGGPTGPFPPIRRFLTSTSGVNSTEEVSISYSAVGTCRNCQTTSSGSFDMFDEAFRRRLQGRQDNNGPPNNPPPPAEKKDCKCFPGLQPTRPAAPKVTDMVLNMNDKMDKLRLDEGMFPKTKLLGIKQLNLLSNENVQNNVIGFVTSELGAIYDAANPSKQATDPSISKRENEEPASSSSAGEATFHQGTLLWASGMSAAAATGTWLLW